MSSASDIQQKRKVKGCNCSFMEFLMKQFNMILDREKMPEKWRKSILMPMFKHKGDVQGYSNYKGIKLMGHTI